MASASNRPRLAGVPVRTILLVGLLAVLGLLFWAVGMVLLGLVVAVVGGGFLAFLDLPLPMPFKLFLALGLLCVIASFFAWRPGK